MKFYLRVLIILAIFGSIAPAQQESPKLLLDKADVAAIKARVAGPFAEQWKQFLTDVDQTMQKPVELPPRGGNWSHNYVCPEHGEWLTLGKQIGPWQWEHICPADQHVLTGGDPSNPKTDFDGDEIRIIHLDLADQTIRLGIAFQVTGDAKYAKRSREILMAYADQYLKYPLRKAADSGHVQFSNLTESTWLTSYAQGADLVWQTLSADDRSQIEEKLFRPAMKDVILNMVHGAARQLGNHQCHGNAAIGLVGFLLNDKKLIDIALNDPVSGFRNQLAKGVLDDGMWFEGSSGYHYYTIEALWPLAEAARHAGINLYTDRFKSMFIAPELLSMPDRTMPALNDGQTQDMVNKTDLFELAYARWHDPSFAAQAAFGQRKGRMAILFGEPFPADVHPAPELNQPRNLTSSGYAILQKGVDADATWLLLKYGPHGGGHGHFDKNQFILWDHGQVVMPAGGTHAYGSSVHGAWDKQSLADNTLTVDTKHQDAAEGKCVAFGSTDGIDYAMTDAGPIYKSDGVRFIRTIAMIDSAHLIIVDQIHAKGEHTFDLAAHMIGKWDSLPDAPDFKAPASGGYELLHDLKSRTTPETLSLKVNLAPNRSTIVTLIGGTPTDVITGTGIGMSTLDRVPIVLFRRKASSTTYVWSVTLDANVPKMKVLPANDANKNPLDSADVLSVSVEMAAGETDLLINPDARNASTEIGGETWKTDQHFACRHSAATTR